MFIGRSVWGVYLAGRVGGGNHPAAIPKSHHNQYLRPGPISYQNPERCLQATKCINIMAHTRQKKKILCVHPILFRLIKTRTWFIANVWNDFFLTAWKVNHSLGAVRSPVSKKCLPLVAAVKNAMQSFDQPTVIIQSFSWELRERQNYCGERNLEWG